MSGLAQSVRGLLTRAPDEEPPKPARKFPGGRPATWTPDEDRLLLDHYATKGVDWCVERVPNHTRASIMNRASVIGATGIRIRWTPDEDATLLRVYPLKGIRGCIDALPDRAVSSIEARCDKLKLTRRARRK